MASFHPGEIVGDDVAVLFLNRGQIAGTAELWRRPVAERQSGKPAVERAGLVRNAGIIKLGRDILVVVVLVAMGVDAVVTKTEFVHVRGVEGVSFAQRDASIGKIFDAVEETAA